MLDKGRNGGEPICERSAGKPDRSRSAGYAFLQSQEPLPPYELDPMFDNPVIRKRHRRSNCKRNEAPIFQALAL